MNIITHALAPVIIIQWLNPKLKNSNIKFLGLMLLFGALPDLLNPHFTLEGRLLSWSHALPCWLTITIFLWLTHRYLKSYLPLTIACFCSFAYLFHIACDAITGGVSLFYPFNKYLFGGYYIHSLLWIALDIVSLVLFYIYFRSVILKTILKVY